MSTPPIKYLLNINFSNSNFCYVKKCSENCNIQKPFLNSQIAPWVSGEKYKQTLIKKGWAGRVLNLCENLIFLLSSNLWLLMWDQHKVHKFSQICLKLINFSPQLLSITVGFHAVRKYLKALNQHFSSTSKLLFQVLTRCFNVLMLKNIKTKKYTFCFKQKLCMYTLSSSCAMKFPV